MPYGVGVLKPRILLVDDDVRVREAITRQLVRRGFDVVATSQPLAALARVVNGDRDFAALITDFEMSEMLGPELAANVAQAGGTFPVLVISGRPPFPIDTPVLAKPFTAAALYEALARLGVDVPTN